MNYNNIAIDWVEVDAVIASANKIILTTHENPDGDGLGSEVALFHHLAESGKDVKIINCSPTPEMYDFLNIDGCIETFNKDEHSEWVKNVDLAIVFDVGDIKRTRSVKDAIDENNIPIMNIDHHPHPENHSFTYNIVDIKSAATGCMVRSYLNTARKKPLTKEICEGIYVAVMTDTGCFRYSNTDTFCHSIAIECLEKGVNASSIYQIVYENSSKTRVSVLGEMISNIGYDLDFSDNMGKLFPHMDIAPMYKGNAEFNQATAFRNSSLQGAYFMMVSRALGLDCGPMSGFNNAIVDEVFFSGTNIKSNFLKDKMSAGTILNKMNDI